MAILYTPVPPSPDNPSPILRFERSCLVLVEGIDDQFLIGKIAEREGIEDVQVHDMKGNTNWPDALRAIVTDASFKSNVASLGLVRDADSNPEGCWSSCKSAVEGAGLVTAARPVLISDAAPRVGIFVVPSATQTGALEELCLASFPANRLNCVDEYFECIGRNRHATAPSSKAKVQVYLAGLGSERRTIAVAVQAGSIDLAHAAFADLRSFLNALCVKRPNSD